MIAFIRDLLTDIRWTYLRRGLLMLIWVILMILTHIPVPKMVHEIRVSDKIMHLIAYFPLGLLLPKLGIRSLENWKICLAIIGVYGICDELLQIPVGRTASVFDWLADMLGAGLGLWTGRKIARPPSAGSQS